MNSFIKSTFWLKIFLLTALLVPGCGRAGSSPVILTPTAAPTGDLGTATQPEGDFSWLHITPPTGWRETAPGHYEGSDGFAWLELLDSQGAGASATCMIVANREKPERYGAYPEIRDLTLAEQPACLILPSVDQPADRRAEALYLLWLPDSIRADGLLALHADREHITGIVESLGFAEPPTPAAAAPCDFSIAGGPAETTQVAGLRVDAFPIAQGEGCSPYAEASAFNERAESGPAAARAEEVKEQQWQPDRLARLNAKLAPFGFRVESYDALYRVLRKEKEARSNLSWVGQVSVRADGQDFIFPVLDGYNATAYLVRPNGVQPMDEPDLLVFDQVFPVYAGADRISLLYDYERYPRPYGSPALLEIRKNGTLIDTISVSGANPAKGPVRGLWSWQDEAEKVHWTLEIAGLVIQDGESLNEQLDTPDILTWRLLKEKPFYLFREGDQVRAVYDGQTLPGGYEEVIAGPQWSDRILVQMRAYESGLVFYAKKGGVWYLMIVETNSP